ncbi:MAG: 50S ribosomal protein L24 [Nitrosotalea sp.]
MNPAKMRHRMLYIAPLHLVSKQLAAPLSKALQEKYTHQTSARVVEGDSVKVLRGEFKGIEGKVTNVSTLKRGIAIEGIKREKLKGGNVDIYIHPSNVMITALNLDDKWRQNRLEGQKPTKTAKPKPAEEPKETKPKDVPQPKEKKEETKEQKPKQKETKAVEKTAKANKEQKSPKSKKSDK